MSLFALNMTIVMMFVFLAGVGIMYSLRDLWRREWKNGALGMAGGVLMLALCVGYIALLTNVCTLPDGSESTADYCPASIDPPTPNQPPRGEGDE